jgi:hypothetical protein
MPGCYRIRQAVTGESGFEGARSRLRGSRHVGLVPREGLVTTWHRTRRRLRPPSKCEGRSSGVCSYVVLKIRLQKSIGDHCWLHRSPFTGQKAGSIVRSAGGERGPSPRRRTLLTLEKSRTEAEPRAKQASRESVRSVAAATPEKDSKPVGVQPSRMRVGHWSARGTEGART